MSENLIYVLGAVVLVALTFGYVVARKWQAREKSAANEAAMLRTLVDNLPDLIYLKDVDGRFLLANVAVARIMGAKSPGELLGKNDFDFHSRELATLYYEDEQVVIRSGRPLLAREEECRAPAGHRMHLETTKVPLRDGAGSVTGLVGIGRDITLRVNQARALDEAVRESREVIQAVLGGSERRIALHGKSGNLLLLAQGINELIDSVSRTVAETMQVMRRAVDGDLTTRMKVDDKLGDFRTLAVSVNSLIQAMMGVVGSLSAASRAVQVGAEEISRGNRALSSRTEEQASSLVQTTAAMDQMTSMVKDNANNAAQASRLAEAAREQAEGGGSVVGTAVTAMNKINAGGTGRRTGSKFRGGRLRGAQSRVQKRHIRQGDQSVDSGFGGQGE